MSYYPLSQVIVNLHTNGGEYMIASTKLPYSGYYWKNSKGQYFTGKTPQDTPTNELVSIKKEASKLTNISTTSDITAYYDTSDDSINYLNLNKTNSPGLPPIYSPNIPTQNDYQVGEYRRYFCKKTNELIYLEISADTYVKLVNKDPKLLYFLYQPFNIPWQLTGDKTQVYNTNKNIVGLTMKQQKLPKFDLYLKEDFMKFYQ